MKHCADTKTPCIPFLGIHLQDLTFNDDGNVNTFQNGMINFRKRIFWANLVRMIQTLQEVSYNFNKIPHIFDGLYHIIGYSENQLDSMVESIKKGSSLDLGSNLGVRISNQTKVSKDQKLFVIKLEEQATTWIMKRVEIWERWIENFHSEEKDIISDQGKGFLSFSEVFFQSKALRLLFNTTLEQ